MAKDSRPVRAYRLLEKACKVLDYGPLTPDIADVMDRLLLDMTPSEQREFDDEA